MSERETNKNIRKKNSAIIASFFFPARIASERELEEGGRGRDESVWCPPEDAKMEMLKMINHLIPFQHNHPERVRQVENAHTQDTCQSDHCSMGERDDNFVGIY